MLERIGRADHTDHESARRARALAEDGANPAERMALPRHGGATSPYAKPAPDPLLDSNVDIPLDRIAREFRKRAGRAFGLGDDAKANAARAVCKIVEEYAELEARKESRG
jgi:hypothetical protein